MNQATGNEPRDDAELAGEFVLGLLQGDELRRFEQRLAEDSALAARVLSWQVRLSEPLADLPSVEPPGRVWHNIDRQLGGTVSEAPGWLERLSLWRAATAVSSLAALLLAALLLMPPAGQAPLPVDAMLLQDESSNPWWMVVCDWRSREVRAQPVRMTRSPSGQEYRLWLLRKGGLGPLPLGRLPDSGDATHPMPGDARWQESAGLAVSLEPAGSEPSQPSGRMILEASMIAGPGGPI